MINRQIFGSVLQQIQKNKARSSPKPKERPSPEQEKSPGQTWRNLTKTRMGDKDVAAENEQGDPFFRRNSPRHNLLGWNVVAGEHQRKQKKFQNSRKFFRNNRPKREDQGNAGYDISPEKDNDIQTLQQKINSARSRM